MSTPLMLIAIGAGCTLGIPAVLWLIFGWPGAAAYWAVSAIIGGIGWAMFNFEEAIGLFTMWPVLVYAFLTN